MNFYALSSIFNVVACLSCAGIVLHNNIRNKNNVLFAVSCLGFGWWSFFYIFWQLAKTPHTALLFCRAMLAVAPFTPVLIYHDSLFFAGAATKSRMRWLKIFYGIAFVLMVSTATPLYVRTVEPRLGFSFWPIPGPAFYITSIYMLLPIVFALRLFWEYRQKAAPFLKNYSLWIIFAQIFAYAALITNLALWFNIPLKPYGTAGVGIFVIIMTFLLFDLKKVEFQLFLRNFFIYFLTSLMLGLIFTLPYHLIPSQGKFFLLLLAFFISPVIHPALQREMRIFVGKMGLWKNYFLKSIDSTLVKIRESTFTYDDLAKNIVHSLRQTLPVESTAVYFYEAATKSYILRAQEGLKNPKVVDLRYNRSELAISDQDPMVTYFLGGKRLLIREEMLLRPDMDSFSFLLQTMEKMEADICIPLRFIDQVKGLLSIGRKRTNDMFNQEDMDVIYAFSQMAEEVMRYIMGMETELKNTALYSHDMHHDTRAMLQALQFLQSPLAETQPRERLMSITNQAEKAAARLDQIVENNRDRSNLILKNLKGEYETKPVDIARILKSIIGKYQLRAEEEKVALTCEMSHATLPMVGNESDLTRVFDNLVNNALRYVKEGGSISISTKESNGQTMISIKDNGQGISPENLEKIWRMGWQGQEDKRGSSGFGLSIVKQIIELHKGTISVQSEGLEKGTEFLINLPLKQVSA